MIQANTLTVRDVQQALDQLAPPELAAVWDTAIGLGIGNPAQHVSRALLALDATPAALNHAAAAGCQLMITHHPLLFNPLPAICLDNPEQNLIAGFLTRQMSLLSAHTNLDAAPGGVADCLADRLDLIPASRLSVGPYGRIGQLAEPLRISRLARLACEKLGSAGCRINTDDDRLVSRLAVFPGSFSEEEIPLLQALGAEAMVCGEIKHHVGLMLAARGIAAIDAGHDVTERVVLGPLAQKLAELLPQISFAVYEGLDYNKMAF